MSQFERIAYIDKTLHEMGCITVKQVVQAFEVTERQVKRDIEYLRNRLNAPIDWDAPTRTYRYSSPFDTLRFADERMLLFYVMVRSIAGSASYLPIISRETLVNLEHAMGKEYRNITRAIRYEVAVSESINLEHLALLCSALKTATLVQAGYQNAQGESSSRLLDVQRLINYMGKWYLIALDTTKNSLRTFQLSRFSELSATDQPSTWLSPDLPEKDRQLDTYLDSGFGMFNGTKAESVTIRFTGNVAGVVSRQLWHAEQKDCTGADSLGQLWLERTLPVSSHAEILGRVLSFGRWAHPVAPESFIKLWHEEVRSMLSGDFLHGDSL